MSKNAKLTPESKDLLDDASNYDKNAYQKAANTVDVCICRFFNNELQVLLIKRKYNPYKDMYAIPGGYVDIEKRETLEESALRELEEETSVKGIPVYQLKTYGDPDRDPRDRTITTAYYALVRNSVIDKQTIEAKDDARAYKWFSLKKLPKNLAFDHKIILNDLLLRLRGRIFYTEDAFNLVEEVFTLPSLKKIYEFILERKIDNFSRKINHVYNLELVESKEDKLSIGRPAKKYRFWGVKQVF